ncbi:MAG TPA: tetratricopeptide repeat protein [Thermodesulfovibrionales bacterium]|nr:tetratricopeptide repeat protein [Thermodesulfovibrionales bacterium]
MKKIVIAAIVSVIFAVGCQQKEEPKQQFQPPIGQMQPGGISGPGQGVDMAKLLQETVQKDPKNLKAWTDLGNLMMDTHRYQEAINAYTKALELDPRNANVRTDMGTCYRNIGKPDIAIREYKKSIEIDPKHINAHKNMAVVLMQDLKDYQQAVKEFERTLEISPNAPDAEAIRAEIKRLKALSQ